MWITGAVRRTVHGISALFDAIKLCGQSLRDLRKAEVVFNI